MRFVIACFSSALLAACASVQVDPPGATRAKVGRSVELHADARTEVGGTMLSEFSYVVREGAVTTAPFERSIMFATIRIPRDSALLSARVDGKDAFCTPQPTFFNVGEARSTCLFDSNGDGVFDQAYVVSTLSNIRYDVRVPYRLGETVVGSDGFKYELLYEGIDHDALRISYREYKENLARAAFQQDLVYTLKNSGPTLISFRGVRMEISSADNNEVRYRVLSGFNK